MVSVGTANVEDRRDLLWIVADELVRVVLTAEPQIINDVVHHDGLSEHRCWALCDQATALTPRQMSVMGSFRQPKRSQDSLSYYDGLVIIIRSRF